MKRFWITIAILIAVTIYTFASYHFGYKPTIYKGQIVNRVQDSFVVQVVIPATHDELIGYEIGDEYLLQEVTE